MARSEPTEQHLQFELPDGADAKAANADSVTPIPPPKSAIPTTRDMLAAGLVTGITAAIICLLMRILAWVFRADFMGYIPPFGDAATPVPWQNIVLIPLVVGFLGSLVAAIFLGVKHAEVIVNLGGGAIFLVSLTIPLWWVQDATWPTRIWLALMYVATWLIIVPQLARIVGDSDPRVTASFRDDAPVGT